LEFTLLAEHHNEKDVEILYQNLRKNCKAMKKIEIHLDGKEINEIIYSLAKNITDLGIKI